MYCPLHVFVLFSPHHNLKHTSTSRTRVSKLPVAYCTFNSYLLVSSFYWLCGQQQKNTFISLKIVQMLSTIFIWIDAHLVLYLQQCVSVWDSTQTTSASPHFFRLSTIASSQQIPWKDPNQQWLCVYRSPLRLLPLCHWAPLSHQKQHNTATLLHRVTRSLHYHKHTRRSLLWLSRAHIVPLPRTRWSIVWINPVFPNKCSIFSCLSKTNIHARVVALPNWLPCVMHTRIHYYYTLCVIVFSSIYS